MIIFLQNAWSPVYAGTIWPRRSWLRALARSPSGRRLKFLTDDLSIVHNAAPLCGDAPSSIIQPDPRHIRTIIESCKPQVIVACGKLPEIALRLYWRGPLLCLPHPAHRVLTNALYEMASLMLEHGVVGQKALRQRRGGVELESFA